MFRCCIRLEQNRINPIGLWRSCPYVRPDNGNIIYTGSRVPVVTSVCVPTAGSLQVSSFYKNNVKRFTQYRETYKVSIKKQKIINNFYSRPGFVLTLFFFFANNISHRILHVISRYTVIIIIIIIISCSWTFSKFSVANSPLRVHRGDYLWNPIRNRALRQRGQYVNKTRPPRIHIICRLIRLRSFVSFFFFCLLNGFSIIIFHFCSRYRRWVLHGRPVRVFHDSY